MDVLSSSYYDDKVLWHENIDGVGLSWTTHEITSEAHGAHSVLGVDVDGDGDTDVLSGVSVCVIVVVGGRSAYVAVGGRMCGAAWLSSTQIKSFYKAHARRCGCVCVGGDAVVGCPASG